MRLSKDTKDVTFTILGVSIKLDGWEVLLAGGVLLVVVGSAVEDVRVLLWIGLALIGVWVVTVFLVSLGIVKPKKSEAPAEGGGTAQPAPKGPAS